MSDTDYSIIARTPITQILQLPIDQLQALLERCCPLTRAALDPIFRAR
ncbi:hypothetical protein [Salinicola sp. CPA57]|nr:hypothetical protein [Salinicola sp. CPA57]